ncbi:Ig-like domain repeat protein [Telmatobacter bradus]|uniref:Ig-like domain repeat protein n=1 Tax=Telmatobacter bradus TaxID=474953 RepID=UPI003B43A2E5
MKGFTRYIRLLKGMMLGVTLLVGTCLASAQANITSQINISTSFSNAAGLALDLYGNLYVADSGNDALSKFTGANGSATTVLSSLNSPQQIALDSSLNLYVANGSSNTVYKYSFTSGALNLNSPTTLGSGLGKVTGVAVDISGNVYIVDNGNKRVVKISGTTQTTILSGLTNPQQIAVDKYGNVYVADEGANAVVSLPSGGSQGTVGSGQSAPQGVAVDATGNLYIADTGNNAIEEVPYSSTTSALVTASQATLGVTVTAPTAVAVDTRGSLYIAAGDEVIHYNRSAIYFGLMSVGSTSQTFPVVFNFTSTVAPATIQVFTQGKTGQDFQDAGSSTCTAGSSYTSGSSCTVNVNFTPLFAGARYGAIVFYDSSNNPLLRAFIGGGGLGPVLTIDQSTLTAPAPTINSSALKVPYSVKPDLFGNIYIADTSNTRVVYGTPTVTGSGSSSGSTQSLSNGAVVLSSAGAADDIAINGAGDLYESTTAGVLFYPNLNGTISSTSTIVSAAAADKFRIINVDVAGNAYGCDSTTFKLYMFGTTANSDTQILSGISSACVGIAVDLYGNFAISDSTLKGYYYVPANGGSTVSANLGLTTPWGVAFDASGSIYMTDYGANYFYRVPNEWGTPNATDVLKMTANKAYSVALDPYGNLYMSTVSSSATYYNALPRAYPYITQAPLTTATSSGTLGYAQHYFSSSVAVGSTSVGYLTLSNSGNVAPTYTNSTGYLTTGDTGDFLLSGTPSTVPAYATCGFTSGLPVGQQCYIPITLEPTSPGAYRSMNISFPSDDTYTAVMTLVGKSSGTAASTASGLAITQPTASIYPTEAVTFTATAASAATGEVTLMVDGVSEVSAALSSGSASLTLSSGLAYGSHTIGVTYAGDKTYAPVTTPVTITVSVVKITPTVTLVSNGNQANVGQTVTLTSTTATHSGYDVPTGTVTFYDGSTSLGSATLSDGAGSLAVSTLTTGTHTITSTYGGDSIYASGSSSSSVTIVVGSYLLSKTIMTVSPTVPSGGYTYGTVLSLSAQVAAADSSDTTAPTGSVVFNLDGSVTSVAMNSSDIATLSLTPDAGSHVLVASYAGDKNYAFSNSTSYSFTTVKASTSTALTTSLAAAYATAPITLTATVSSTSTTPTGTVMFLNGVTTLGTATLSSGVATLTTQALPSGTDSITAVYNGSSNCSGSTSSAVTETITINTSTVTVTSVPVIVYSGEPTLTATIGYTDPTGSSTVPSGTVTFYANGTELTTVTVSAGGTATYSSETLSSGTNVITATYSGDSYFAASTSGSDYLYMAPSSGWNGSYTVSTSSSSATVAAGSAATFTITATPTSNYFGYVQFTCSGLPSFATCEMATDQILLNGTNTPVSATLTIYTTSSTQLISMSRHNNLIEACGFSIFALLPMLLCGFTRKGREFLRRIGAIGIVAILLMGVGIGSMTACCALAPINTEKGTYNVTVNATGSGSVNTSTTVKLVVQ